MKNSKFTETYLKIIAEENTTTVETKVENEDACPECGEDPCTCEGGKVVSFKTTDPNLIDTINSGFQEVVFFVNAKDENGEDTVQEVKFGPEAFGELEVIDDTAEDTETTECGDATATEEDEEEEQEEQEEQGEGEEGEGEDEKEEINEEGEDEEIAAEDWLEDGLCVKCGDPKCDGSCKCPKCGSMNCIGECGDTATEEGEEEGGDTATEEGDEA